jgi:hypothetical protein
MVAHTVSAIVKAKNRTIQKDYSYDAHFVALTRRISNLQVISWERVLVFDSISDRYERTTEHRAILGLLLPGLAQRGTGRQRFGGGEEEPGSGRR